MVMTTSVSPRRTMTGLLTAASLAAAGWATAPAWSCPADKAQSKTTGETKCEAKCQTITACQDAAAPAGQAGAPAAAADKVGVTFCAPSAGTAAPAWGVSGGGKGAGAPVGGVYVTSPAPPAALYTIALNSTQSQDEDVSAKLARLEKQLQELQNALAEVRASTGTGPRPAPFVGGRADRANEHALKLFAQGIATGGRSAESPDTLAT
ncbi:MAG: hypothetical protein HZB38_14925, partial [Planctomycetes bacterium]|nr:hypothetical protein [Planctomycetota bacterium]